MAYAVCSDDDYCKYYSGSTGKTTGNGLGGAGGTRGYFNWDCDDGSCWITRNYSPTVGADGWVYIEYGGDI